MSDVRVLDRTDETLLHAYWVLARAAGALLPLDEGPSWEVARTSWALDHPEREITFLGAYDGTGRDESLRGGAWVGLPLVDNLHLAHLELCVDPDARRAGHGSALLAAVEALAARAGRTTVLTEAVQTLETGEPTGGPGSGDMVFGERRGYVRASTDEAKVADLTRADVDLPALEAEAAAHAGGRTLQVVAGRIPDDLLDDVCALLSRLDEEIPLEDLDLEARTWTPQRHRDAEARREAAGKQPLTVLALDPDGRVVGLTDLTVAVSAPTRASVGVTLVLPEHRGHRLGLALKARLHAEVGRRFPAVTEVLTWNAGVNAPMNAVNDRLGYRVLQHVIGLQKRL